MCGYVHVCMFVSADIGVSVHVCVYMFSLVCVWFGTCSVWYVFLLVHVQFGMWSVWYAFSLVLVQYGIHSWYMFSLVCVQFGMCSVCSSAAVEVGDAGGSECHIQRLTSFATTTTADTKACDRAPGQSVTITADAVQTEAQEV